MKGRDEGPRRIAKAGFDRGSLDVLVCPASRGPLTYDDELHELHSPSAALAYPVRSGVAVLVISEARRLDAKIAGD